MITMLFYITIIFAIIFDILTKYLASIFLQNPINLLGDFLYLQFVKNSGIAFSISLPFLKIITIVLIIGIFYYYITNYKLKPESGKAKYEKQKIEKLGHFNKSKLEDKEVLFFELSASNLIDLSFGFILGGAIGNGIERVFFSEVSDFIGIKYFAIFNFADIFITIGVILYLIYLLKFKK